MPSDSETVRTSSHPGSTRAARRAVRSTGIRQAAGSSSSAKNSGRSTGVPVVVPGVLTAGILTFVNSRDEFLLALSLNSKPNFRTLPVGIMRYQGEFTFPWPIISAALIVAIVPIAVLIAIFQEGVVGGLTQGGLKG